MGLFGKKNDEIPEIGSEELGSSGNDIGTGLEKESDFEEDYGREKQKRIRGSTNNYSGLGDFEIQIQKVGAKLESLQSFLQGYSERFSTLNQQIGELRSSSMENEKNLVRLSVQASKAIELVNDVQPDKLRLEYQRLAMRLQSFEEKVEMQKEMVGNVFKEFEDFKNKSRVFIGTEGLLKLNNDVQKALIEAQKLVSVVKLNADKSQNIFTEVSRGFAESEKKNELVKLLEKNYSDLRRDTEEIKLRSNNFITKEDIAKFQAAIEVKLEEVIKIYEGYTKMISYNENLGRLVQKLFLMNKSLQDKIEEISPVRNAKGEVIGTLSNDRLNKKLDSLLNVVDNLSDEILKLKFEKEKQSLASDHYNFSSSKIDPFSSFS